MRSANNPIRISSLALLAALLLVSLVRAEDKLELEKQYFKVPYVDASIDVDAKLDEDFWQDAVRIDANIEVRPGENIPSPVKTEALLAYSDTHIYVAIVAHDPDPSAIRAHLCDRDELWDDDWVLILFDTFNDQRRTYDFFCNPFGVQADEIETPQGGGGGWDAIWESNGRITDEGYLVEMAIPFSSFSFPRSEGEQTWGFDVVRSYPRSVRHHIGAFPRDRNNNCYMCQSHKLIGFNGARPGKNVEVDPTFTAVTTRERQDETTGPFSQSSHHLEPGFTSHWRFTPNLTLNATINPDFSNVEADAAQMDINRQFTLYYDEKRPFFLEGADFFRTSFTTVHTRTLADPRWGLKVTGKEGANAIGLFTVQDDITNFIFPGSEGSDDGSLSIRSLGNVFRYRRDVSRSSNIGVVMTDRRAEGYHNTAGGVDGLLKFTKKDQVQFQVLGSNTKYPAQIVSDFEQSDKAFGGTALQAGYEHDSEHVNLYGYYQQVDPDFRADLGFMTRAGYRYSEAGGTYKWRREPGHWYNWLSVYSSYDLRRDYDGNVMHRALTGRVYYEGPLQSYAGMYGELGRDLYDSQYFRMHWLEFWFGFRPSGAFRLNFSGTVGDQIDYSNTRAGKRLRLGPLIAFKTGLHFSAELRYQFERLNVDTGRLYSAHIGYLKAIYQINKRAFVRVVFQSVNYKRNSSLYIDDDDILPRNHDLFSQILFSYKINPQTVLFLGYSDNYYGDNQLSIRQTNRTFFTKVGYAWRL